MVRIDSAVRIQCTVDTSFSGTLKTAATWIREFVRSHPDYKFDSVVSQEINYDLLLAADQL